MPALITISSIPPRATSQLTSAKQRGFSLVEMAIVLVIVGMLATGGLAILAAQQEMQRVQTTTAMLDTAKEALLGFAAANGRLPCPATAASNGQESPVGGGVCTNAYTGFLPAVTLGLTTTNGNALDAWNTPQNRIHYAVTTSNVSAFTTSNGMHNIAIASGLGALTPDLYICTSATGITPTTCGTATSLATNAVAVIYSLGKNASTATGGTGTDEAANPNPNSANNDQVFVSHTPTNVGATNGEFDDIVTWLSPNILYNRMLAAGRLP